MKKNQSFWCSINRCGYAYRNELFRFVGKRLKCGRYTVRYCYCHSVYSKYACGFVDSRIKCDNA